MKMQQLPPETRKALRKVWSNLPRQRKPKTAAQRRRETLWARYGLREDEYARRVMEQNGLCAICGEAPSGKRSKLFIDHQHGSKAVRGLLCSHCNSGLGYFKDSPARLASAIAYLASCGVKDTI
jgi:formate dehydrogenase maturation protein FdhE